MTTTVRGLLLVAGAIGLGALAGADARAQGKGGGAPKAKAKPKAVVELEAVMAKGTEAWSTGNIDEVRKMLAEDMWSAWDSDMNGRPAAYASAKDVLKFFEETRAAMKAMGASIAFVSKRVDCHASGDLGVCTQEGEYTMTMPNMPPVSMPSRETEVFRKQKGAWRGVHHHGSLAKAPDMPKKFMAINARDTRWQDAPGMPGLKFIPIWTNPVTQAMAMVFKAPDGMKQARHIHPFSATFSVIDGTFTTTDGKGRDRDYGPGAVIYRAANEPHTTTLKPGTVIFAVTEGALVSIDVDEQGKPLPPKK